MKDRLKLELKQTNKDKGDGGRRRLTTSPAMDETRIVLTLQWRDFLFRL